MLNKSRLFWLLFSLVVGLAISLRFWHLPTNPPSLYWEEVALGYDAYSILKTGRDHHGHPWPVVAFESFGDWKPSLYFYAAVPSIALVGLNEWGVRLPSAIAGVWIVVGMGLLVRWLWQLRQPTAKDIDGNSAQWWQLVAMAVTAISPWSIIFSRGGWEANLATGLILGGVVSYLWGIKQSFAPKTRSTNQTVFGLALGTSLLALSMYAYHSARVIAPFTGLGLIWTWWLLIRQAGDKHLISAFDFLQLKWQVLLVSVIPAVLIVLPLTLSLGNLETQQRFNETNIFADLSLLQKSQALQLQAGQEWWAKLVYHRYVVFSVEIIKNSLTHFDLGFLFLHGDENVRHSIQFVGHLYHIEIAFWLLGWFVVVKRYRKFLPLLVLWLASGILAAAMTKAVPHALRILPTLPVWLTLITLGISELVAMVRKLKPRLVYLLLILVGGLYFIELVIFIRFYAQIYPNLYAGSFSDGYQAMVVTVNTLAAERPELPIYMTREEGRPAMYYWFYSQTDPDRVQAADAQAVKDQGEYLSFENMLFPIKTDDIKRPAIVAVTTRSYQHILGQAASLDDPGLHVIKKHTGEPIWVVFIYE